MLINSIKIGDRVEIQQNRDNDNSKTHVSQVENILEDNRLILHVPISYGKLIELVQGNEYKFLIFTEKGLLRFSGIVEKRMEEDGFDFMQVHIINNGDKIQRRDFFRFSCVFPMSFVMVDDETLNEESDKAYQGLVKDIGGGGICFITNENIEENKTVKVDVKLENEEITVIGEVIQKHYFPKSNYRYQYRVGFIGISPKEQEKIVHFIFNEQKRMLRRINKNQ